MPITITQPLATDDFSPLMLRLLDYAAMEARRDQQRGGKIFPEHIIIAALQDDDPTNLMLALVKSAGLTIADVRSGKVVKDVGETIKV